MLLGLFVGFDCEKLLCREPSSTRLLVHINSYFYCVSTHEQNSWVTRMHVFGSKFYPKVFQSGCTNYSPIEGMNFGGAIHSITL